jgi:uncharacterized protein (DUF2126 family)/transglutaminase-like putative cysteine protease
MGIRVGLYHKTTYDYDRPVTLSPQTVRLRPAPHTRTPVTSFSLRIEPKDHFINWQQDPQGNFLARLVFPKQTRRFSLEVDLVAEMTVINPFDFFLEPYAEKIPFRYETWEQRELEPFLKAAPAGPRLQALLDSIDRSPRASVEFLVDLNQRLQRDVRYLIRPEPGVQTPEQTLEYASGSCRDTGWLLVEALRHLGLAARFVSGYLIQLKPDAKPLEGPVGPSKDFTDLHAWAEVYLPGAGWVGLDPTSGLFAGEGHIPLAATPEPRSAAPVTGLVSPSKVEFHHEMRVTRILEPARVTKPYSEEQWQRLYQLGERIDEELVAGDVRLTMGGEPTFVSMDDMEGEEWNTAALGPAKERMAGELLLRLREEFGKGGLLHYGQGKWYPGEPLPRWTFSCYWRTDGVPLWNDASLLASIERDCGFGVNAARQFAEELARRLEVGPHFVINAYEDALAYLLKERKLPANVDPLDNKLDDPLEREKLRHVFERGLGQPVGYVLPLKRAEIEDGTKWKSCLWTLRSEHLYLLPGDSPVGLRLPLETLIWEPEEEKQKILEVDPTASTGALPIPVRRVDGSQPPVEFVEQSRAPEVQPASTGTPWRAPTEGREPAAAAPVGKADQVVRTALAVEPRGGRLYIFIPPVESVEDYIDLLTAVEDTAAKLHMPVVIEGYAPPHDPRLRHIKLTPDPGVLEVNVHPAASWRELVANTNTLYEQARLSRLGTEKFMLDGRHTGTGGGNHLVLGGPTPADSPFLRRPDILKSMLGYWLNHPSLSYLFSSTFIGPTSQAPRVDETRADSVYELEIAFSLLRRSEAGECPPWMVDRIFRHLLVDVTGNTHRAEFCIDKLYSPDSATGRLGLVELRSFEMPPHARMSLAQQLLVRALVAWFWREPYEEKPIRWGTRLHDRFLLPYFVQQDFRDVLNDLTRAGYPLEPAWFAPQWEFRFPACGEVGYDGVDIELRQAIEPWYVLGEEPGPGGTARYVDSSVERLQVRAQGLVSERFALACNGRRLPMQSTGTHGDSVCGVRFRAWQPPHCLHPTIPVHTPLIVELIDIAAKRSIGGCTYYVAHPGGRNYETFPVNSNEAEARRRARFYPIGHTPDIKIVPPLEENPDFPATLDLRREVVKTNLL